MTTQSAVLQYSRAGAGHSRCAQCQLGPLCLGADGARATLVALESVVRPSGVVAPGTLLHAEGERFSSLYAIRSGCVKTVTIGRDGRERVLGFHLPGDIVGFDAIDGGLYRSNAVTLGSASYCSVPFQALSQLAEHDPALQGRLLALMSRSLALAVDRVGDASADQRVAAFLIGLSARFSGRGYSPVHFVLAMPRRDIANFLRLATETVSRVLTRFQQDGLIRAVRREVMLLDVPRLEQVAGGSSPVMCQRGV